MSIIGIIIVLIVGSLISYNYYSDFKDAYQYGDTWETIKNGGLLLIITCAVLYGIFFWFNRHSIRSEFKNHIYSYTSIIPKQHNNTNLSYAPKIVIIDKNKQEIHKYHFSLSNNEKALKPSDVDIIVWLEFDESFYDYYGTEKKPTKTAGYIEHCIVTLINNHSKSLISKRKFSGQGRDKISVKGSPKKKTFRPSKKNIMSFILNAY